LLQILLLWIVVAFADPNGTPCLDGSTCDTGLCVDDVCCDDTCDGQCEYCGTGTCSLVNNQPPQGSRPACADDGTGCGGICYGLAEACDYPEDLAYGCLNVSCDIGTLSTESCDGAGACASTETDCSPYVCTNATCLTSCFSDDDCLGGFGCSPYYATCEPWATEHTCPDAWNSEAPDGEVTDCFPYKCALETGLCADSCADDGGCQGSRGYVCRVGECVDIRTRELAELYPSTCSNVPLRSGIGTLLLVMILACGRKIQPMEAEEVCLDLGFSIANVVERCTADYELANERFFQYEKDYRCKVTTVRSPEIQEYYVCPVKVRNLPCDVVKDHGKDLDGLIAEVPVCLEIVERKDGQDLGDTSDTGTEQ